MLLTPPEPITYVPPLDPYLQVVHSDDHILVLNKPSGLLSVPGKAPEHQDCLENRARDAFPTAATIHRLDMDTSGLLVMALNPTAHRHIGLQFEKRMTRKTYFARVWDRVTGTRGTIDLPLICDWPNRPRQMVDHQSGKPARTHWLVAERQARATRMQLTPVTGRSHQLRVHMLALGHPILGDALYAHKDALQAADRLQLHAAELSLFHPEGGRTCIFKAECPF